MDTKTEFCLPVESIKSHDDKEIIDYNNEDFRNYWKSASKTILNDFENSLIETMLRKHNFEQSGWFFDIGCGFGRNCDSVYNKKRKIVLVDYALNHLEMAAKIHHDKKDVYYIAADAYNLPFKEGVFSGGLSIRLFHHINRPQVFLNELSRIMKKSSQCILTYINKRNFFRIFRYGPASFKKDHAQLSRMIYGTHPRFFKELLSGSGFKKYSENGSGYLHQITQMFKPLDRLLGKNKVLFALFSFINNIQNRFLGKLRLALLQFTLLRKQNRTGKSDANFDTIQDIIVCPQCKNENLKWKKHSVLCPDCNRDYVIANSIIDFRIN